MTISEALNTIRSECDKQNNRIKDQAERNIEQMKVLASVKVALENIYKRNQDPANILIECIDSLRKVTPHYSTSAEKTILDPPLTEDEKNKIKEVFQK